MKVGYLCSWRSWTDEELRELRYDLLLVAFAGIEEGRVKLSEDVECLVGRLKRLKIPFGLSVGGWTFRHHFQPLQFDTFLQSLAKLDDIPHIDIDWEFEGDDACRQKPYYQDLIVKLSTFKQVSCAISLSQTFLVSDILQHLQFVTLMAYDQSGPWGHEADHYAPLSAVKEYNQKYLLGISTASAIFHGCQAPMGDYEHCEIVPWCQKGKRSACIWDAKVGSSYRIENGAVIYEEDEWSIGEKERIAGLHGLGGTVIWDVTPRWP